MVIIKQPITIRVGATDVVTYPATSDFTTEAIEWVSFEGFALNVWFPTLNGSGASLDIEVSNTTDLASFKPLVNSVNVELVKLPLPRLWEIASIEAKYIRFIYNVGGVTAGSTVTFNFNKLVL